MSPPNKSLGGSACWLICLYCLQKKSTNQTHWFYSGLASFQVVIEEAILEEPKVDVCVAKLVMKFLEAEHSN